MGKYQRYYFPIAISAVGYAFWIGCFRRMELQEVEFPETEAFFIPYKKAFDYDAAEEVYQIYGEVKKFKSQEKTEKYKCKLKFLKYYILYSQMKVWNVL